MFNVVNNTPINNLNAVKAVITQWLQKYDVRHKKHVALAFGSQ
jgi:hypothetical protein